MSNHLAASAVPPARGERLIKVDTEHFGIRFLVPVLVIGLTLLAHFVGMAILGHLLEGQVNPECVVLPLDVVVLFGSAFVVERILKRLLPSRRSARLSDQELALIDGRRNPPEVRRIDWGRTVNVQAWRFIVRRKTRVPKGWYCMALHLLQDETEVIVYTFMAPQRAEALRGYKHFIRLRPRKETQGTTDLSAVAQQRRLLKLEDARWDDGAEISAEDFEAILEVIERRVPEWD